MWLLRKLNSWLSTLRLRRLPFKPKFYVRICRRKADLITLINEASNPTEGSEPDLIRRVLDLMIEGDQESSVFGVLTDEPLDPGHAVAVVAESIRQDDFVKKKSNGCTRSTIFLPADIVHSFFSIQYSPHNNLNFAPADDRHFDIKIQEPEKFAKWLLDGFNKKTIRFLCLSKGKGSFQAQARVAHAVCVGLFGSLSENAPPENWRNGKSLTASEQLGILRFLSGADELLKER